MGASVSMMSCLGRNKSNYSSAINNSNLNEKAYTDIDPEAEAAASDFLDELLVANCNDDVLHLKLRNVIHAYGWTESIAEAILNKLIQALHDGVIFGQVVMDALERAQEAARNFACEHPYYTALIAMGVLAAITPWVLTALGFGEIGIVEGKLCLPAEKVYDTNAWCAGSVAAMWQARFAGFVPKGSLFSFLQRCGMVLRWKLM